MIFRTCQLLGRYSSSVISTTILSSQYQTVPFYPYWMLPDTSVCACCERFLLSHNVSHLKQTATTRCKGSMGDNNHLAEAHHHQASLPYKAWGEQGCNMGAVRLEHGWSTGGAWVCQRQSMGWVSVEQGRSNGGTWTERKYGAKEAQWWEHLPPTNVAHWLKIPLFVVGSCPRSHRFFSRWSTPIFPWKRSQ